MQEQEYEQRLQDVENKAIGAVNEERKRGDELEVRLSQAQASHDKRVEDFKVEANTKHDQRISEEGNVSLVNSKLPMHKQLNMQRMP